MNSSTMLPQAQVFLRRCW